MHRSQRQPPSQRSRTQRGRSRSPPRSRTASRRRHRHHSRSRSPRPRQLTNRAQQQDGNSQWEDHRRLLDHWRADRDFLDSNMVYGLALPRKGIRTSASRTLGIDQTPIHEIRLIQLMQEGSYDSISYYKKLPPRRTFPVTSQSGKTANKQVPSWWKMLVDTWLDWYNKLPPQKSWDASGSWNKKMRISGQVKRILPCTSQYILKIPNQPNHLWMREELPLQFVVNGICHHLYISLCHTVHPRP